MDANSIRAALRKIPFASRLARLRGRAKKREFLLDLLPKHAVGAEIGVHLGDFSQRILERAQPTQLHLIDPWEYFGTDTYRDALYGGKARGGQREMDERYAGVCRRFHADIQAGRVHVHRGYSVATLEQFADAFFDWIYVDGNHLYDYVKADLEIALRKTKPGGIIAGDDYVAGGWWKGGVRQAVDEFVQAHPVQLVEVREAQFVLRVLPAATDR